MKTAPTHCFKRSAIGTCALLAVLAVSGFDSGVRAASIAEPSTVFYGQVIGTGGEQPFVLHEGDMIWKLRQADGSVLALRTTLYELDGGAYSYRLDIPHSVLADETDPGPGLPLPPTPETSRLEEVTIDGEPAYLAGPAGASFQVAQETRAATYRLDLELGRLPEDSDGDGMPDWWEDQNGLNPADAGDAGLDLDGDGVVNRDEYRRGLDPNVDNRIPQLVQDRILAFPGCLTGIRLTVNDTDSTPENLVFTVGAVPAVGQLLLRNQDPLPGSVDKILAAGDTFTLQDVQRGLLVLSAPEEPEAASMTLSLRDETAGHPEQTGTLEIAWYAPSEAILPATADELRRRRAQALGRAAGAILWDEALAYTPVSFQTPSSGLNETEYTDSYEPAYGRELSQIMTAGRGDDALSGGMADDLLVGGRGADTLTGHGGADLFVFDEGDLGVDRIEDFTPAEGDVLDLAGVLRQATGWVKNYIAFEADGADTQVGVDLSGQGNAFDDLVVTLSDTSLTGEAAYDAVLGGSIEVGALRLEPRVSVELADAEASENGDNAGVFTVRRDGDLNEAVSVSISLGGSAQNGVDYALVGETVVLPAGQAEASVRVRPFADSQDEPAETVELVLLDGEGYRLGTADRAELQILDLQAVVGIEVLEALGSADPLIPGILLVTRNGKTSDSLVVRLQVGGSASNGVDYDYLPPYVTLQSGQTAVPVPITVLPGADLAQGAETVTLSVVADGSYARADEAQGRVVLVPVRDRFASWLAREFPEAGGDPSALVHSDPGETGFTMLQRYAFGMDPQDPSPDRVPAIRLENRHCVISVPRNPAATDIRLDVEQSTDMQLWQNAGALFEQQVSEDPQVDVYRSVDPAMALPRAFLRITVHTVDQP